MPIKRLCIGRRVEVKRFAVIVPYKFNEHGGMVGEPYSGIVWGSMPGSFGKYIGVLQEGPSALSRLRRDPILSAQRELLQMGIDMAWTTFYGRAKELGLFTEGNRIRFFSCEDLIYIEDWYDEPDVFMDYTFVA